LFKKVKKIIPEKLWNTARRYKRKLEFEYIKSDGSISKKHLIKNFHSIGIKKGDLLFVHSSLRSIGFVDNGPISVIEAIMDVIGPQGTLVFPTFSINKTMENTLNNKKYIFDPDTTPSTVGKITEVFRKLNNVKRSIHPTHSVAALGPLAEEITNTHLDDGTNFGKSSPLGKIYDLNGKIFGLGINFGPVTFYHVYEDFNLEKFPGLYNKNPISTKVIKKGKIDKVEVFCHDSIYHKKRIDKSPQIESFFSTFFQSENIVEMGYIGKSLSWWINAKDMFDSVNKLFYKNKTIYEI
tara:strand:- start:2125 stop:3009 length:885 start_codon:yes stop_codon:yes gene_type:complete